MDVELRQIRSVVAVADERSFTAAGQRLHVSQQSVSALVQRLERNLGVVLFDRTTRHVAPTPECEMLLPTLRSALAMLDRALVETRERASRERPLALAVTPSIIFGAVQQLLGMITATGLSEPQVKEVWPSELAGQFRERRVDAALAVEVPPTPGLVAEPWRVQRIDLLVAATHPFATLPNVTVAELSSEQLMVPEPMAKVGWYTKFTATLARSGVQPSIVEMSRLAGPAPTAVHEGTAVTVWLSDMDRRYVPAGLECIRLTEPDTMVTTYLVLPAVGDASVRRSIEVLREAVEQTHSL